MRFKLYYFIKWRWLHEGMSKDNFALWGFVWFGWFLSPPSMLTSNRMRPCRWMGPLGAARAMHCMQTPPCCLGVAKEARCRPWTPVTVSSVSGEGEINCTQLRRQRCGFPSLCLSHGTFAPDLREVTRGVSPLACYSFDYLSMIIQ